MQPGTCSADTSEGAVPMKRATLLILMCLVFSVTVVSVDASAGEGKRRVYEGTLSNGSPIDLKLVVREDRPPGIAELDFGAEMTCDDGTVQSWFIGWAWLGGRPPMPRSTLRAAALQRERDERAGTAAGEPVADGEHPSGRCRDPPQVVVARALVRARHDRSNAVPSQCSTSVRTALT